MLRSYVFIDDIKWFLKFNLSHTNPQILIFLSGFEMQVGVMGTHDEDTRRFFKHTNVACLLAPRYADKKSSWFKQKVG
jgi:hypothetical protein